MRFKTKGGIAPAQADGALTEGVRFGMVRTGAGHGSSAGCRVALRIHVSTLGPVATMQLR